MTNLSRRFTHFCIALISVLCPTAAVAEEIAAAQQPLQVVLDSIHKHAADGSWRKTGWQDQTIDFWLDELNQRIAKATGSDRKLPVRMTDVHPGEAANNTTVRDSLIITKNLRTYTTSYKNCVLLSDGNVFAKNIEGCVVVARGAASMSNVTNSVVISGTYLWIGTDGQTRNLNNGSLLLTRGWMDAESLYGSVVFAPEGITTGRRVDGAVFINTTLLSIEPSITTTLGRPRSVKIRGFSLGEVPNHRLSEQIQITGVIYPQPFEYPATDIQRLVLPFGQIAPQPQAPRPTGVVVECDGRHYVAEFNKPVVAQSGERVTALTDWRLSYAGRQIVVFSGTQGDAVFRLGD